MNYYLTQEQYEQLKEMGNSIEFLETLHAFDELITQIGNQPISTLIT
jgi:hypothetical protein